MHSPKPVDGVWVPTGAKEHRPLEVFTAWGALGTASAGIAGARTLHVPSIHVCSVEHAVHGSTDGLAASLGALASDAVPASGKGGAVHEGSGYRDQLFDADLAASIMSSRKASSFV